MSPYGIPRLQWVNMSAYTGIEVTKIYFILYTLDLKWQKKLANAVSSMPIMTKHIRCRYSYLVIFPIDMFDEMARLMVRWQAIIWTNAGFVSWIKSLGTWFSEIFITTQWFSLKKMQLNMSPEKWRKYYTVTDRMNAVHPITCDVIKWKHFRVTGHLCGEFTGPRWIPHTKASDVELWCFLWSVSE